MDHGQLSYLQIPALDITASARFYERVFGWRVDPPGSGFEAPLLIGQWILDRPPAPDAGPVGWIHVDDLERTLDAAQAAGGEVRDGPTADGPRRLASFTDPAGNLVGVAEHGPMPGTNRTMPACTVIPELLYEDVIEAIEWLCAAFGFVERWRAGEHRAQLAFGDCAIAITEPRTSSVLPGRQSVMVRVADARAHHERARDHGARITQPLQDFPYGERQYSAEDLGGHRWTFSQSIADVAPEEWGGTSGPALGG
jgi:predicted enzyme related to lactoylglutathione lyase